MNLLFVCSRNRLRSPTAEALFAGDQGTATCSAGTSPDAETPVSVDLIEWADIIFVMEGIHRKRLNSKFATTLRAKRVVVLGIPDDYAYMDPALVQILRRKLSRHLPDLPSSVPDGVDGPLLR